MLPSLHRLPVRPTGMPAKTRRVAKEERKAAEKELARQEANVSDLEDDDHYNMYRFAA